MSQSKEADDRLAEFAWSAWSEFGVSSWTRRHREWHLDPEALLLLTSCLGRADARLRGEVLDWCASYGHLLSRARARTLLATWPGADEWPTFAADLGSATGQAWPGAAGSGEFRLSGKSALPLQGRAACLPLRARALLGVGARSEIVRILLLAPEGRTWSRTELATEAAYTRRNVHDAVESLLAAGASAEAGAVGASRLTLARRTAWIELLGPLPDARCGAAAHLRAAWAIARARAAWLRAPSELRSIEARAVWPPIEADLRAAAWPTPELPVGKDAAQILDSWSSGFLDDLAAGELRRR
jgi:hypothetical protein